MQLQHKEATNLPALHLSTTDGEWWNEKSKNLAVHNQFYDALIPSKGEADTVHGMLLRAANKIYYDIYNNGGGNLVIDISCDSFLEEEDEHGNCETPESEHVLDGHGVTCFGNLERWMPLEHQDCVKEAIKAALDYGNDPDIVFDHLLDRVVHTVATTNNIELKDVEV